MGLYEFLITLVFLLSSCLGLKFGVAVTLLLLRQVSLLDIEINPVRH